MKRTQIVALSLLLTALDAASACSPKSAAVTNSNNLILLGGNAKGAVKQDQVIAVGDSSTFRAACAGGIHGSQQKA